MTGKPSGSQRRGPRPSTRNPRPTTRRPREAARPGKPTVPAHHQHAKDEWTTPRDRWSQWDNEFRFTLDAAATDDNALCRRYFTMADDGLTKTWRGRVWCNPPYSRVDEFVQKGYEEVQAGHAEVVVLLVASRTDTRWWHDFAMNGKIRFIRGRLKFSGSKNSAPFASALVIFRPRGK